MLDAGSALGTSAAASSPGAAASIAWVGAIGLVCFVLWRQNRVIRSLHGDTTPAAEKDQSPVMFGAIYAQPDEGVMQRGIRAVRAEPTSAAIIAAGVLGCVGILLTQVIRPAAPPRSDDRVAEVARLRAVNDSLRAVVAAFAARSLETRPTPSTVATVEGVGGGNSQPAVPRRATKGRPAPAVALRATATPIVARPLGIDAGAMLPPPAAPMSVALPKP